MKIKNCSWLRSVLKLQVCAWLVLSIVVTGFAFKVSLTSDLLFFDEFIEDIFHFDGSISAWKFPPASAIFPDIILYGVSYFVFDSIVTRVVFVCAAQAFLLAWACLYLGKVIRPEISDVGRSVILLIVSAVGIVSQNSDMWLFFNSTNNHFAALLGSLTGVAWLVKFVRDGSFRYLIGATLATFMSGISTSLFALTFTIPIGIMVVFWFFVRGRRDFKKIVSVVLALLLGSASAAIALPALLPFSGIATRERLSFSIDRVVHAIKMLREAFAISFSLDNPYTLCLSVSLILIFIWLIICALSKIKVEESPRDSCFLVGFECPKEKGWIVGLFFYWIVSTLVCVTGSILTGAFLDPWGFRYFAMPVTTGLLLWILILDYNGFFARKNIVPFVFIGLALASSAAVRPWLLIYKQIHAGVFDDIAYGKYYLGIDLKCLNEIEQNGFVLGAGVGDYANSRALHYRMKAKNYILPFSNDGKVFFQMMGLGPVEKPSNYGVSRYNFVILNKSNTNTPFNLTPDTLGKLLPRPGVIHACKDSSHEVWLYLDDQLDMYIKSSIDQFLFGLSRAAKEYKISGKSLPGSVGKVVGNSRIAEQGIDAIGLLTYGPYTNLAKGRYVLSISYQATADDNKWDFGVFGDPNSSPVTLGGGNLKRSSDGRVEYLFEIDKDFDRIEIRTWYGGVGQLIVNNVQIRRED